MQLLSVLLLGFYARHYAKQYALGRQLERERVAAYRHPALQPATIYSPEFYASLSARYNRPFLGK